MKLTGSRLPAVCLVQANIIACWHKWVPTLSVLLLLSFNLLVPATVAAQSEESGYQEFLNFRKEYQLKLRKESLKRSKDPEATQKAFVDLHEKFTTYKANPLMFENWEQLNRQAKAFLKLKPEEPFSKLVAGRIVLKAGLTTDIVKNCEMIQKAASGMKKYSLEARLFAAKAVHETVNEAQFRKAKRPLKIFNRHLDLLIEWMSKSKDPSEDLQRRMYEEGDWFVQQKFTDRFDMLPAFKEKLDAAKDKISPWVYDMLAAEWHYRQAWKSRGGGYASTVKKEGWVSFEKNVELAQEKAKRAYKLHPERPEAAAFMINIAKAGETDESERTWFDRAVEAEFDYMPAYKSYLISLLPRWNGSHEAMIDFMIECTDTNRYDTRVPLRWTTCFSYIFNDAIIDGEKDPLQQQPADYVRQFDVLPEIRSLSEKYQAYLRKHSGYSVFDTRFFRATEFSVAYKLKQYTDAYEIYQKYNGDVLHPYISPDTGISGKLSVAHMLAANGAAADDIEYIEEQTHAFAGRDRTAEECDELLDEIEAAAAKNDLPGAELYFEVKREFVKREIEFHRGKWVNLEFTPELYHWGDFGGRFDVKSPTTLVATSSSQQIQYVAYNGTFPTPYEVELTVKGIDCFYWSKHLPAGIVCGRMQGTRTGRFFWVDTLTHQSGCTEPGYGTAGYPIGEDESVRLKIKVFDGYYEMFDGVEFQSSEVKGFKPGRLGVGVLPWRFISGKVEYSDFRVRKLEYSKPPRAKKKEARIKYYKERLESEKTYLSYVTLAQDYMAVEQFDDAVAAFKAAESLLPEHPRPNVGAGFTYLLLKKDKEASQSFEAGLKKSVGAFKHFRTSQLQRLAWLYATSSDDTVRDGGKAVKLAEELLKLGTKRRPLNWEQLSIAAAGFAEGGKFEEAIKYVQLAIKAAKKKNKDQLEGLKKKLKLYQDGKPFHIEK